MKKFAIVHIGFEKPTQEIMGAWGKWFESIKEHTVEMIGLGAGCEISSEGTKDLPMGLDSMTGISIVNAESMKDAERLASTNPYITSVRIYEIRGK